MLEVAVAVVEHNDAFLVGVRPTGSVLAGRHEFPGGKIRQGESATEAARRECWEETGIEVTVVAQIAVVRHSYEHADLAITFFHCRPNQAAVQPNAPFVWTPRSELAACEFPPANAGIVAKLVAASP